MINSLIVFILSSISTLLITISICLEECHAEMMYAELNVGWILLAVLRAKSFSTLLKVVMRLRETIYIYRYLSLLNFSLSSIIPNWPFQLLSENAEKYWKIEKVG